LDLGEDVKQYPPLTVATCAQRCRELDDTRHQDWQSENNTTQSSFTEYNNIRQIHRIPDCTDYMRTCNCMVSCHKSELC